MILPGHTQEMITAAMEADCAGKEPAQPVVLPPGHSYSRTMDLKTGKWRPWRLRKLPALKGEPDGNS